MNLYSRTTPTLAGLIATGFAGFRKSRTHRARKVYPSVYDNVTLPKVEPKESLAPRPYPKLTAQQMATFNTPIRKDGNRLGQRSRRAFALQIADPNSTQ